MKIHTYYEYGLTLAPGSFFSTKKESLRLNITQAMVAFPKTRWVALILNRSLLLSCVSLRVPHPCVGNFLE